MQFSPAFILTALPFLVVARQPLKSRQPPANYSLLAIHTSDQAVHNQPIVASNEAFYTHKYSSTTCSVDGTSSCNAQTEIILGNSTASLLAPRNVLNVEVPGGQELYVSQTGGLAYTPPHSHAIPEGAKSTGFSSYNNDNSGSPNGESINNLAFARAGSPGWLACPIEEDNTVYYQIFANVTGVKVSGTSVSHCHDISIALLPGNGSETAYQFN